MPWNRLCAYLIGPYVRENFKKDSLNIKDATMIDTVTGWFEIVQYDDKRAITIANLVETTWLSRYPRPMKIIYNQGKHFIGHEFRKSPI